MPGDTKDSTTHFLCILTTIMDCMEGSQIYCCSDCVAQEIKDWADAWLQVTHELEEEE
jgi:hypothetical protein